jgi:hypothetical protein
MLQFCNTLSNRLNGMQREPVARPEPEDSSDELADPSQRTAAIVVVLALVMLSLPGTMAVTGSSGPWPGLALALALAGSLLAGLKLLSMARGLPRFGPVDSA